MARALCYCIILSFAFIVGIAPLSATAKGGKGRGSEGGSATAYIPMAMDHEDYKFRNLSGDNSCLGEDDHLDWQAFGSLQPGESFSFTPLYAACNGHTAAISVTAFWSSGPLELASTAPDSDFVSWDDAQQGKRIIAPVVANSAQLCMFPSYREDGLNYTITLTNRSEETIHNIVIQGQSENDWPKYYYPRCLNADADNDGWNDALEHTMGKLVAPNIGAYTLWGSNYLRDRSMTAITDDEVDSYPPDLNDNGIVDGSDLAEMQSFIGQGNGIPLERISPNRSDAEWFYNNNKPWRRYDLDGDGWVDQTDVDIMTQLIGQPVPMLVDSITPTARLVAPLAGDTVARGQDYRLQGHVWDNAAITQVAYLVDGKIICSVTNPVAGFGFDSPFNFCWWSVPRKSGSYEITVRVTDAAGLVSTSAPVIVWAQ